jgi:Double-GTPase 2
MSDPNPEQVPTPEAPPAPAEVAPAAGVDVALAQERQDAGRFGRGEALFPAQANQIAQQRRATVVILAGSPDSGKTTLLAALYERFGLGKLAGHWFLGSRTLHGFELRCHRSVYGRGPGGGSQGRTAETAAPWLHLRTARQETASVVHELLLGDFSGEHFRRLANGTVAPSAFPALRRADHICLTISGGALGDPGERAPEERELTGTLEALLADPNGIADTAAISFVVTKWDLVHAAGDHARDAVQHLFATLRDKLPDQHAVHSVGYIQTAARSTVDEMPIGYGIGDLLSRFTDRPALHVSHPPARVHGAEPFDMFTAGPVAKEGS